MKGLIGSKGKPAKNNYHREVVIKKPHAPRKRIAFGGFFRWSLGLGLGSVLLYGLVVGALHLYRYATTSDFFAVRKIEIRGAIHYPHSEILKAAKLQPGINSLELNIADMERAIRENAWVQNVAVKRMLPDGFEILLEEKRPVFWVLKDGILQYADAQGAVIAPVDAENFLSLPTLEILPGGEALLPQVADMVAAMKKTRLPLQMTSVSRVRVSAAKGFELYLENSSLTLCIAPEGWNENLERLAVVLSDLARRGDLKQVREIWVPEGNIWVVQDPEKT